MCMCRYLQASKLVSRNRQHRFMYLNKRSRVPPRTKLACLPVSCSFRFVLSIRPLLSGNIISGNFIDIR